MVPNYNLLVFKHDHAPHNLSTTVNIYVTIAGWCNFERGLCIGWNQSSSDDFDWTLGSGSTPSSSTGPTHDQGGLGSTRFLV